MTAVDVKAARAAAIATTIDRLRTIEKNQGITRPALQAIEAEMQKLASQQHLFPTSEFPPPPPGEKSARRYLLHQDEGGRFALYMNALNPGNETKPHDHTTWAVIVAVEGQELNRVYRRAGGNGPGQERIELEREVMVEPGRGIAFMPDDIHSIHTAGSVPTRHLHVYGLALEKLDGRKAYDAETGEVKPYNVNFLRPTAGVA